LTQTSARRSSHSILFLWWFVNEPGNRLLLAKHFDGKRFYNPGAPQARGLRDVIRWQLTSRKERSPAFISDVSQTVPPRVIGNGEIHATLINHSTVLLQHRGLNILTDPIWSERASPVSFAGPRRRRIPGVSQEALPPVDIVLLSHNHYDHLDLPTLRWLSSRGGAVFIVPLGVARLLRSEKIGPVHEFDWGEEHQVRGLTFCSVPAFHFAARGISDRNKTLWCGYVIKAQDSLIYYAGDTAFGDHIAAIRDRFGPPDLSLLPIGAYEPRWFMSPVHMAPEQAVDAHRILGSATSIAIHHGTFQLADEGLDTPAQSIAGSAAPPSFLVLKNGESVNILPGESNHRQNESLNRGY
jgi:L-ascorbate metabolism protein UlaG (beta-lactamase superfamily)